MRQAAVRQQAVGQAQYTMVVHILCYFILQPGQAIPAIIPAFFVVFTLI